METKNIIAINLEKISNENLFSICLEHDLDFMSLYDYKTDNGLEFYFTPIKKWVDKIWVDIENKQIIALLASADYISRKETHYVPLTCTKSDLENLKKINQNVPKIKKNIQAINLYTMLKSKNIDIYIEKFETNNFTIDQILDKINESSLESLSKREKKFLENYSKNL